MNYANTCGPWKLQISPPSPRWVEIDYQDEAYRRFTLSELYDLQYLIERAIAVTEATDQ